MNTSHTFDHLNSQKTLSSIRINQLQWILLIRLFFYSLLIAFNAFLRISNNDTITLPAIMVVPFLAIIYSVTIYSAIVVTKKGRDLNSFSLFQTCLDTVLAAFFIYLTGCSLSIFTSILFFPIIAGGLILPNPQSLAPAALATILYAIILFFEFIGFAPSYLSNLPDFSENNLLLTIYHFSVRGLTFFLAAFLTILFSMRLQQTESALSESLKDFNNLTELYRQIFNNISTGIITINPEQIITSTNQSAKNILGLSDKKLLNKKINEIFPDINLDSTKKRMALSYIDPSNRQLRIGYSHMLLPRSDNEAPTDATSHKILTLQDITEVEKLEAQVRQSEKLAAIGTMSASIAHDFRNPLTAINGSAQILASELANAPKVEQSNYELCNIILRESNRLIDTISDFLKFSRPETANCQWFSLANCIDEVIEVCKATPNWPGSCTIDLNVEKNLDIWADQNQLFVILDHLIHNSLAFCPKGNERLSLIAKEINEGNKSFIELTFRDNGSGVPDEIKQKIVEPFFTTRADGTGLGMAIIHQNISEHGGSLNINDAPGGGAEFRLTFPLPA